MIKEAIEYLLKLKRPEIINVDERNYSTLDINPVYEPESEPIKVFSLSSLIDYLREDPDKNAEKIKIVRIVSPVEVVVESSIFGNFKQREKYIIADYSNLIPNIAIGSYVSIEQFIIMLKSKFIKTDTLDQIIKIVGNVSDENVTNYNDDGITQKVTAKTGIARVSEIPIPTKINLIPYRTFIEVKQPESEFLLRAKKYGGEIEFAIFEADGGAWKRDAIDNISNYLRETLSDINNIIILD